MRKSSELRGRPMNDKKQNQYRSAESRSAKFPLIYRLKRQYHNRDALSGVNRVPLPYDGKEKLIIELQDQLDKAEEKIVHLQQLLQPQSENLYVGIKLTRNQETVVDILLATNGICSKERLYAALYLSRQGYKPDPKVLRETVRVIRKQLRPHGIEIKTVFGKGYTMPRASKAKLTELVTR